MEQTFEMTDAYAGWFLMAVELRRRLGYQCRSGNIPGAPGAEIYHQAFLAGKSPEEANALYFQAEQTFLANL
jgi:hypothetical protein